MFQSPISFETIPMFNDITQHGKHFRNNGVKVGRVRGMLFTFVL